LQLGRNERIHALVDSRTIQEKATTLTLIVSSSWEVKNEVLRKGQVTKSTCKSSDDDYFKRAKRFFGYSSKSGRSGFIELARYRMANAADQIPVGPVTLTDAR
jgi:hypothetical protein